MNEKYGGIIFTAVMLVAIASAILVVMVEEHNARIAVKQKCETAGWTWFATENKCIMVKEIK
jgi:hypothetical protein